MRLKVPILITASAVLITLVVFQHKSESLRSLRNYISQINLPKTSPPNGEDGIIGWPQIIWQTSKYPSENQTEAERELAKTWADMNPYHMHHMMTHERMLGYIEDNFHDEWPELEDLYLKTTDYMMRTDVLRYLVLLHEGGVYNDLDVECLKPIQTWLPVEFKEKAGMLIGIEIDNDLGPSMNQPGSEPYLFEFVPWTIMAKPNQPYVRFVIDWLQKNIADMSSEAQAALSQKELLNVTGPAATTAAFMAYASEITGTHVTYMNFTKITAPVMIGEVVILPIWAFGAGHQVRNSGFKIEDHDPLVHHHFADSWRKDHG